MFIDFLYCTSLYKISHSHSACRNGTKPLEIDLHRDGMIAVAILNFQKACDKMFYQNTLKGISTQRLRAAVVL